MTNETKNLLVKIKDCAKELGIQAKQEIYASLTKAIQLIPSVVGNELVLATFVPMIPSLLYDTVKREIFEKDISNLGNRLFEEREKINRDFINSPLGRKLFKDIIKEIFEETDKDKIEYQKRFLLNAFIQNLPNIDRLSAYHKILLSLEPPQLRIIGALSNFEETVRQILTKRDESKPTIPIDLRGDVRRLLKIDNEIFERAITRLETDKLIARDGLEISWYNSNLEQRLVDRAKEHMESALSRLVTDFGKEFVSYFKDNV